jgi:solute carrier family 25 (peroxisomal adenine nucleotide transporter), member 17
MFKEEEDFKNQHNHDGIFGGSHATTSTTAIAASARTNFVQPVDHALAGSLSSMFVFALLYPLDVARTRQQSSTYRKKKKVEQTVSVYQSVLNIYKEEGVNGLYSGFSTNVISIGTSQCLYFFFHELIKDSFINIRRISLFQNLFVAFIAGCINATVTCPMWVAATRLKLKQNSKSGQGGGSHENNRPTFASSLVNVIVSGDAWRGLSPSLILCTNPAIQYGIYEQLKTRLLVWWSNNNNKRIVGSGILNPMPALLIGAISKSIATIFTYVQHSWLLQQSFCYFYVFITSNCSFCFPFQLTQIPVTINTNKNQRDWF